MLMRFSRQRLGERRNAMAQSYGVPRAGTAAVLVLAAHLCLCLLGTESELKAALFLPFIFTNLSFSSWLEKWIRSWGRGWGIPLYCPGAR